MIPDFRIATDERAQRARRRLDDDAHEPAARVGGGRVKLTVDAAGCMGHGRCYQMAPRPVHLRRRGVRHDARTQPIDVPADQVEAAEDAEATCPEQAITLIHDRPRRHRRRRPVRLLRRRPAAAGGCRGRPVRRAADAVRPRARRRRARPPEDQVGHADVRPDRRSTRASASSAASSSAPTSRREELLERYHAVVYAVGTPRDNRLGLAGEERPGSVAPPSSSPGTTATRGTPTRPSICPARAPS